MVECSRVLLCVVIVIISYISIEGKQPLYRIGIGHDFGAQDYINDKGYLAGFTSDLILQVCEAGGLDCRTVWDKYVNCWASVAGEHSAGGQGLMGQWYNACAAWYTTIDRIQTYSFSTPYLGSPKSYFYVKKGKSFDPSNIEGKKIAFLSAWAANEKCVARQSDVKGHFLDDSQVSYVEYVEEFTKKIEKGEVDAGFTTEETMSGLLNRVDKVGSKSFDCMIAGNAMMARKDSTFPDAWSQAFLKFKSSGAYKKMCENAQDVHGHKGTLMCLQ